MSVQVTIYTGTGNTRTVTTSAEKWSQLVNELRTAGISYDSSNTKAVVGETENTLESNDALIPTENFTLFLLPKKVKSGFEESYEESYDEDEDVEDTVVAPAPAVATNPRDWTKQDALTAISETISKLQNIATYVQNVSTNPLDDKAKQLMNKLIG